jgi:hypothetical protein
MRKIPRNVTTDPSSSGRSRGYGDRALAAQRGARPP